METTKRIEKLEKLLEENRKSKDVYRHQKTKFQKKSEEQEEIIKKIDNEINYLRKLNSELINNSKYYKGVIEIKEKELKNKEKFIEKLRNIDYKSQIKIKDLEKLEEKYKVDMNKIYNKIDNREFWLYIVSFLLIVCSVILIIINII